MDAASRIDRILHRNRSIFLEIMGKDATEKRVINLAVIYRKVFRIFAV